MSDPVADAKALLKWSMDTDNGARSEAVEALEFARGKQWPAEVENQRKLERRPCLTINKTNTFCRSVENNMRQQRPRIKVDPVSGGATKMVGDVIQGLIRHIEVQSAADLAYDTGAHYQTRIGWGYWRVVADYVAADSFDQELQVKRIRNPFSVYPGPHESPDGSDMQKCLITSRMQRDEFKRQYPRAKPVDIANRGAGDDDTRWATKDEVVVAEFYWFDVKEDKLHMLSDGTKVFGGQLPSPDSMLAAGLTILRTRATTRRQLRWAKVTAVEILERQDLPGKYIPVIPVYGEEMLEGDKVKYSGMVRDLMDPQRMYNYWRTQETEFVALAPKAPWLIAEGQDEGYEDEWTNANVRSFSRLKYKPMSDENGAQLPPPMRQQPQAIPAASVNAAMGASEDMKAVAGMFDPALGAPGNETSGTMVEQRQGQSDLSNYHLYDNLTRSIRHTGVILLDQIPAYYDTARVLRIIGEDGTAKTVTLNEKQVDPMTGAVQKVLNDVTVGLYDVVMDTGPGYQTKRQQGTVAMLQLLATPLGESVGHTAGDLVVRQMDFPDSEGIADRLMASNPIAMAEKKLPDDIPSEAKAFIAHLQQQTQALQQQLQQLEMEKMAKTWGDAEWQRTEIEKERIKAASKAHDTAVKAAVDEGEARLRSQTELLVHHIDAKAAEKAAKEPA